MIDKDTQPNIEFARSLFENIQAEVKNERCRLCNWRDAETCRSCQQGQTSVVLAVNKIGIKGR